MNAERRVEYLLRAASRAEGKGDARTARIFRRMAEDARPIEARTRWSAGLE